MFSYNVVLTVSILTEIGLFTIMMLANLKKSTDVQSRTMPGSVVSDAFF